MKRFMGCAVSICFLLVFMLVAVPVADAGAQQNSSPPKRVRCGRYFYDVTLKQLVLAFEQAYRDNHFVITKSEITGEKAQLWARFPVADSSYEFEEHDSFHFDSSPGDEHVDWCPTEHNFREPTEYKATERNAYIEKFEPAIRAVFNTIDRKFPKAVQSVQSK